MCCRQCSGSAGSGSGSGSGSITELYAAPAVEPEPAPAPVAAENLEIKAGTLDVLVWILAVIGAVAAIRRGLL